MTSSNSYSLPPGAAPSAMGSEGREQHSGPGDFHQFASPLNGLPPLLAPQAGMSSSTSRAKMMPAPAAIQSESLEIELQVSLSLT